jgi:hypothetical protein
MDSFLVFLLITVGSSVFLGTSARHGAGHGRGYDEHHPAERNVQKNNFIQISFSETKKMCGFFPFFISFLAEACPRGWKEKPYLCYE